jgi:glucokinase
VSNGPVVLAIDIGGTKLEVGLVDGHGGLLSRFRKVTPTSADPEVVFGVLFDLIDRAMGAAPSVPVVCGVGCGGPMEDHGATVSPLNIPAWRAFPLRRRIEQATGLPTGVENDAKAMALGEGWKGTATGVSNYLAMVVSTGVGAGIVLDGRLLDGTTGNAGHIGHVIVEPEGRHCVCGSRGCLEAEASGLSIAALTGRSPVDAPESVRRRTGTVVGRAVASVANLLDLQLAVVAGSVALGFGEPFFAAAQAEIDDRARIAFARGTRIVPSGLGSDAPLIGAAAVGRRLRVPDPVSPVNT